MKGLKRIKAVLASLLVTVALVAPAVVMSTSSTAYNAELLFWGASLETMEDGSIQAIFNVGIDRAINMSGAAFYLDYNAEYLVPSYIKGDGTHKQNEPVETGDVDYFFRADKDLFTVGGETYNPFYIAPGETGANGEKKEPYSTVDAQLQTIHMALWFNVTTLDARYNDYFDAVDDGDATAISNTVIGGKVRRLGDVSTKEDEVAYVVGRSDPDDAYDPVVLGQLSFRVNKEHLPEVLKRFETVRPGVTLIDGKWTTDPTYTIGANKTYLFKTQDRSDAWQVNSRQGQPGNMPEKVYSPMSSGVFNKVEDLYNFHFNGKTPVAVRAAAPAVVINAYQAYSFGNEGDIAYDLVKYSPMATVTYADGTVENFVMPWGQTTVHGVATGYAARPNRIEVGENGLVTDTTDASTAYKATDGHYYPKQKWVYDTGEVDGDNKPIYRAFPVPVQVDLTVRPITLVNVTATDLERSYDIASVVGQVDSAADLGLPNQARLITDEVPGGVSMVIRIPGWTTIQPKSWRDTDPEPAVKASTWPVPVDANNDGVPENAGTMMNSLKAETWVEGTGGEPGTPYWPDGDDRDDTFDTAKQSKFLGTYRFVIADTNGGEPTGFTKTYIQTAYPWLTVPKDEYPLAADGSTVELIEAKRHIVGSGQFTDAGRYKVNYLSTVTGDESAPSYGQPTFTLEVRKYTVNGLQEDMSDDSVFRVWLPNGMELGTGLASNDILSGNFTVQSWFQYTVPAPNPADPDVVVHDGDYKTVSTNDSKQFFQLVTNTGDPERDKYNMERETLRRYVNLGGWFSVAVCEDVDNKTWSKPIPVYVPPRQNEYIEDKEYNFLTENVGLTKWFGSADNKVTVPRGYFNPVDAEGRPIYLDTDNDLTTTSPTLDPATLRPTAVFQRAVEYYGLNTMFDGETGAQPGTLYNFTMNNADGSWRPAKSSATAGSGVLPTVEGDTVYQYGASYFQNDELYEAYGRVYQPMNAAGTARVDTYQGTVRVQEVETAGQEEKITLTSAEPTGMTWDALNENVRLATYNSVQEGYEVRQDYTFTITNVGTTDIYGLGIDGLTDNYTVEPPGGRFVMLKAPADYLAPGESTTFVLTYIYDLRAGNTGMTTYYDRLYITSDNHPSGDPDPAKEGTDYLRYFDAQFDVAADEIYTVTVLVYPETLDDSKTGADKLPLTYPMGTADVVLGPQGTDINDTAATRSYPEDRLVYIAVKPNEEYTLTPVVCVHTNDPTQTVDIEPYLWTNADMEKATNAISGFEWEPPAGAARQNALVSFSVDNVAMAKGMIVYVFKMPATDVTVTVRFQEDIRSKLRLSNLIDYSAWSDPEDWTGTKQTADEKLKDVSQIPPTPTTMSEAYTYRVWRKTYTDQELQDAKDWAASEGGTSDPEFYKMTVGTARPHANNPVDYTDPNEGQRFESMENQYLVVIPYQSANGQPINRTQVEATLREVIVARNGSLDASEAQTKNEQITPKVTMEWYPKDLLDPAKKQWQKDGKVIYGPGVGSKISTTGDSNQGATKTTTAPNKPTVHTSIIFDAPEPGTSDYVRITVEYQEGSNATEYRYYFLELHRAPAEVIAQMGYGNSPYGMIMNEKKFHKTTTGGDLDEAATKASQDKVKGLFRDGLDDDGNLYKGIYTFKGMSAGDTPDAVQDNNLDLVTYWREAWVKNGQIYEAESGTGRVWTALHEDESEPTKVTGWTWVDKTDVYDPAENLDLNDYAFFAILGEDMLEPGIVWAKDSSGRLVDLSKITVKAQVKLLNTSATTQRGRFAGAGDVTLDFGVQGQTISDILRLTTAPTDPEPGQYWPLKFTGTATPPGGGDPVDTYGKVENIRPGRYTMVYTYTDFDGTGLLTIQRPFVVLSPVGDINADLTRDSGYAAAGTDEYILENRMADPLGYGFVNNDYYPWANIYKFRVCDVNNDRNINNIDGNLIDQNVRAQAADSQDHFLWFYHPYDYRRLS